ncbi:MAG: YbhB/YbcL family Raf kinase inhibitor-like protein [Rhizobiales bacterium]|nr:YbhB/YbcL family Raf kinase inhibitor-like protein [Hyphomicrobiales bacterium]
MRSIALPLAAIAAFVPALAGAADFTLSSKALVDGVAPAQVSNAFGCTGGNVSPDLAWSGAPAGTKAFTLTLYDPDAPTGSGFWHWVVTDIPGDSTGLPAGAGEDADGIPGRGMRNDAGMRAYLGPCPPEGAGPHRYVFALTALGVDHLDVPDDASAAIVGFMTGAHALGRAELTVTYGR